VGVPGGVIHIEIAKNKGVRRVREKFRGKGAKSRIELSVSDGRGVDIEEEKGKLLKVDFDAEIV